MIWKELQVLALEQGEMVVAKDRYGNQYLGFVVETRQLPFANNHGTLTISNTIEADGEPDTDAHACLDIRTQDLDFVKRI